LRVGGLLNRQEISRDVGIPRPTIHRYINLLITSFQVQLLEPYSVNRTKRLIRSPKLYWTDTGLALFLAQQEPEGTYFENLVLNDLMAWRDIVEPSTNVLFWRTSVGSEIDFVIEQGDQLIPIEVKTSATVGESDLRHLRLFKEEYGDHVKGALLLYMGDDTIRAGNEILAAPWWKVL
jgi:predicted AAA+ superfamily ATPase